MAEHETLFDPSQYNNFDPNLLVETDHTRRIARLLGHELNKILHVTEYYIVSPKSNILNYRASKFEEEVNTDEHYDPYSTNWMEAPYDETEPLVGFLRGLPLLYTDQGIKPAMHVHALYDDINTSGRVIPLDDIAEIYKQNDEFLDLTAELHEMVARGYASGNSQRYEIPVYYDNKNYTWRNRPADASDIQRIIEEIECVPTQILGGNCMKPKPSRPKQWKITK